MMKRVALEILKKIKLSGHRKLNTVYSGKYRSAFRGNGILFDNLREYEAGDEVKSIDWNVSAKAGRLYVREYSEERELNVVLALDVSRSMNFGTSGLKKERLHEFAAVILQLAQYNKDSVSIALFSDRIEWFHKAKKGSGNSLLMLEKIMSFRPDGRETNVAKVCEYLNRILKKRSVVFLVSDFFDSSFDRDMKILSRRHQLIPVRIRDKAESGFRYSGIVELLDMETSSVAFASGSALPDGVEIKDALDISTDDDVLSSVVKFFEKRNRRKVRRW